MEFAFGPAPEGGVALGLRQKNKFDGLVDLKECRLISPDAGVLLQAVRQWAATEKIAPYNLRNHSGFLRYLVVREGKNTGQRMVNVVTAAGGLPKESLVQALEKSGVSISTVLWTVQDGLSDVTYGGESTVLKGSGFIDEKLGSLTFRISPNGFFQTNSRGAEGLYRVIKDFVGPRVEALVDFYCGAGTIGLFCADGAGRVLGVEKHAPSVEDARWNASRQEATHAEFHAADAAAFAANPACLSVWNEPGTVAIMDPPRPGLPPPVKRLLREHPVERWIYVSCNPKALAVDLPLLAEMYQVDTVQPVDMFPHTPHVETVLLLARKPDR